MSEILDQEAEEKLKIHLRSKRHIRTILIVVNLLLAGYLIYFTSDSIIKSFEKKDSDIVTLNNLSKTKSKDRYNELISGKEKIIGDYVVYGNYLHFFESKADILNFKPLTDLALVDTDNGTYSNYNVGLSINEGLDLSKQIEGDYLISQGSEKHILKVLINKENHEQTFYTLPNELGIRNKVTIYAYPNNPAFVLKIREVKHVGSGYFDLIIKGTDEQKNDINKLFQDNGYYSKYDLQVKWMDKSSSLKDVYAINSLHAINLIDNDIDVKGITVSNFINTELFNKSDVLENGSLNGYDANPFIRELGGYIFESGSRFSDVNSSFEVASVKGEHDLGKMAFEINSPKNEDIVSYITKILEFII